MSTAPWFVPCAVCACYCHSPWHFSG